MFMYVFQHRTAQFQQTALTQLIKVLDELKDEKVTEQSFFLGKRLAWKDETGEVVLTVCNMPFLDHLSVHATVNVAPLREQYMEDRELNGISKRFYFDDYEQFFEFPVQNVYDLLRAMQEMRYLNWLRLNWTQQKTDRQMLLAMGAHSRLGAESQLAVLDENVLNMIGLML